MKVGFIGAEEADSKMALQLAEAGLELIVCKQPESVTQDLESKGARVVEFPWQVAEADLIITMISNDKVLEEVIYGENGLLKTIRQDSIHISMGTISSNLADQLSLDHALIGTNFVGASIYGWTEDAKFKETLIAVAGEGEVIEQCLPIFDALSKKVVQVSAQPSSALQSH